MIEISLMKNREKEEAYTRLIVSYFLAEAVKKYNSDNNPRRRRFVVPIVYIKYKFCNENQYQRSL